MTVPTRFAVEYPYRALELIRLFERTAQERDLTGSFALLAAAAVLTIPYERMKASHFLHDEERDRDLTAQIKKLQKTGFLEAPFWQKEKPQDWRQFHIVSPIEQVNQWRDRSGQHPFSSEAKNTIKKRTAEEVIRVLRNALAHGNIIFLDKDGLENPGNRVIFMAFLSRYEEAEQQSKDSETYRLVVTTEEEFLRFVKLWAGWVSTFALEPAVLEAA